MMKEWFKVGFGVAAGVALGKYVGKLGTAILDGMWVNKCVHDAQKGKSYAKNLCDTLNIDFKKDDEEPSAKMQMGFHA